MKNRMATKNLLIQEIRDLSDVFLDSHLFNLNIAELIWIDNVLRKEQDISTMLTEENALEELSELYK